MKAKTLSALFLMFVCGFGHTSYSFQKVPVTDGEIKRLVPFGVPDTVAGNYFYGLSGIACSDEGRLFLADQQSGCIRVFSIDSGNELYKFGKVGSGPGEFRRFSGIKLLSAHRIIVIDQELLRVTVFSEAGKLLRTIALKARIDDVCFLGGDSLLVCSFRFEANFKPLRILDVSKDKTLAEFGQIAETKKGILKVVDDIAPDSREFYHGWIEHVVILPDREHFLYSQRHPYFLVRYDLKSRIPQRIDMPIDIDVEDQLAIERLERGRRYSSFPSGQVMEPLVCGPWVYIALFSADGQTNYLDCYTLTGDFKYRYKIPALAKKVVPMWSALRGEKELLLLVRDFGRLNWVERFSLPGAK